MIITHVKRYLHHTLNFLSVLALRDILLCVYVSQEMLLCYLFVNIIMFNSMCLVILVCVLQVWVARREYGQHLNLFTEVKIFFISCMKFATNWTQSKYTCIYMVDDKYSVIKKEILCTPIQSPWFNSQTYTHVHGSKEKKTTHESTYIQHKNI